MTRRKDVAGCYDPAFEHDSCGVAFVVDLKRPASHRVVALGLTALENLAHRGAFGADPGTGDGAGALVQLPHRLYTQVADIDLPGPGLYGTGMAFLPREEPAAQRVLELVAKIACEENLEILGWREVPVDLSAAGEGARAVAPRFSQVFVAGARGPAGEAPICGDALERRCFVLRKRVEHAGLGVYFPSLSTRTIVYKGMLAPQQLRGFFPDLTDERLESRMMLVHSRFSTNTFPSWPLAHPYRLVAHNGEINTLAGNRNWMRAREAFLASELFEGDLERIFPVVTPGASDSASFDEVLELLHLSGRTLPHAVLMMIPEAWQNHAEMDPARRAFYSFHASLMEPWDGPAAIAFTDGTLVGAVLDRNGLRPARYWVTDDGLVVLASEVGVLDLDPASVIVKGRLQPGRMFLVDTAAGRIVSDDEIKASLAAEHPYGDWLAKNLVHLEDLPPRMMLTPQHASVVRHQRLFGVTNEELRLIIEPMARTGAEAIGSMGSDTPIAVLSQRPRLLYDYFTQLFAQVTNPPLDAIREELVTSLEATVGPERNLLRPEPASCRQICLPFPVIDNDDLAKLVYVNEHGETPGFRGFAVDGLFPVNEGGPGLEAALGKVCQQVSEAIALGANIIVLSDRNASSESAPIPSLLLTAAVHNHLVREKERTRVGLVIESGDAREVHHFALLIGYGAAAVNPYLALESVAEMVRDGLLGEASEREAFRHYLKAASKGVLKVMSKMGISTVASYTGAQVFEAIGLDRDLVDRYFGATPSRLGGVGLAELAEEVIRRHRYAYEGPPPGPGSLEIEVGGEYKWRRDGEYHLFNPKTVFKLQHATRAKRFDIFREYSRLVDEQSEQLATLPRPAAPSRRRRGSTPAGPPRRGGARPDDRDALRDRRHVVRVDLGRGARDARDRDEPPRRPLEHGGGGRGPQALRAGRERRPATQRRQTGGLGPLRGHERVSRERGRPADQDRPGRQARGGRPAPRSQGLPLDRQDALLDPRRGADLPATSPRHLLDRGPRPAHLRPQERQPGGPHPREAGGRGRSRNRRRRCRQGPRGRRAHLRPRRGNRRRAAHLAQTRGRARGSSAWPRRSRPCSATVSGTASRCRSTAS